MDIALIYELSNPALNDMVVAELRNIGYMTSWSDSSSGRLYQLPKFMVWKKNITLQQGIQEINSSVARVNAIQPGANLYVTRCITLNTFPWSGIPTT